jgi:hypothetical protein
LDAADLSEMIGALTVAADLAVWRTDGRFDPAFNGFAELIESEYIHAGIGPERPEKSLVCQLLLVLGRLADSERGKPSLRKP